MGRLAVGRRRRRFAPSRVAGQVEAGEGRAYFRGLDLGRHKILGGPGIRRRKHLRSPDLRRPAAGPETPQVRRASPVAHRRDCGRPPAGNRFPPASDHASPAVTSPGWSPIPPGRSKSPVRWPSAAPRVVENTRATWRLNWASSEACSCRAASQAPKAEKIRPVPKIASGRTHGARTGAEGAREDGMGGLCRAAGGLSMRKREPPQPPSCRASQPAAVPPAGCASSDRRARRPAPGCGPGRPGSSTLARSSPARARPGVAAPWINSGYIGSPSSRLAMPSRLHVHHHPRRADRSPGWRGRRWRRECPPARSAGTWSRSR